MQSSDSKTKRSRKKAEEPAVAQSQAPASEEATKSARKTAAKKSPLQATPAAKQHRGAAKKATEVKPEIATSEPVVVVSESHVEAVAAPVIETLAAAVAAGAGSVPARPVINQEQIASLAYSYWEARGYSGGSAEEDWLRAEQELLAQ
jgi:hypothetical protein